MIQIVYLKSVKSSYRPVVMEVASYFGEEVWAALGYSQICFDRSFPGANVALSMNLKVLLS